MANLLARRGTTLLETLLAVGIAASAVVLATTFALNGLTISNDLNAGKDFNAASRRVERDFVGDVAQATRFNFGVSDETTGAVTTVTTGPAKDLTIGYTDATGHDIWIHYVIKASAATGKLYLLKTSNQFDPETYQTGILAADLADATFTFLDGNNVPTVVIAEIRRVDLELELSTATVERSLTYVGVMRGTSEGAVALPAGLQFGSIEDANFLR